METGFAIFCGICLGPMIEKSAENVGIFILCPNCDIAEPCDCCVCNPTPNLYIKVWSKITKKWEDFSG
jgi:hypothetical protein